MPQGSENVDPLEEEPKRRMDIGCHGANQPAEGEPCVQGCERLVKPHILRTKVDQCHNQCSGKHHDFRVCA